MLAKPIHWAASTMVLSLSIPVTIVPAREGPASTPSRQKPRIYAKNYAFTSDWFTFRIPWWRRFLGPLEGRPNLRYLEIGLFEGRSALWVLENVLTHPTARLTGIDVFTGDVKRRYLANVQLSGQADKVTTIVGPSQLEVRKLPPSSFDVVYIDGSHVAADVLADAVQAWAVLKPGGILIFDDYTWQSRSPRPPALVPRMAIDAFMLANHESLEVLLQDAQVFLRKRESGCAAPVPGIESSACSTFGQYLYDWNSRALRRANDGAKVELAPGEVDLVESFLRGRTTDLRDERGSLAADRGFTALARRLGLAPIAGLAPWN